jgi:transcriptional regulator with AAA-type ATPase domain
MIVGELHDKVDRIETGVDEDFDLNRVKTRTLRRALLATKGNKMAAARLCGVNVKTVHNILKSGG